MSIILAIYNPDDGQIIRRIVCSESVAWQQVHEGESAIEIPRGIIFDDTTHYIDLSGEQPALAEAAIEN